jgi:hypothetical protein
MQMHRIRGLGAKVVGVLLVTFAPLVTWHSALAQFSQQGPKLVGTGGVPSTNQGHAVAVSADGNTAIVGGPADNSNIGAAWVFARSNGVWTQQGNKLVGTGAAGAQPNLGYSIALSADGNTAIVGAPYDAFDSGCNCGVGAAWVFTRTNGAWTQQGNKLVGTGATGAANQGFSVGLSADGSTAIVGGPLDDIDSSCKCVGVGASWVFTRTNGIWTQQGNRLVGAGAVGYAEQGNAVSLSADGSTAIVGGGSDNSDIGATWVFTRSNNVWTQQGDKLVGTGVVVLSEQGYSIALSADGNTAIVGGYADNPYTGAAWVFTRTNGAWTQQGNKLVGTGAVGSARQGVSVALSADGNTAIVGGPTDNSSLGAAWVFTRSNDVWTQQGNKLVGTGSVSGSDLD